MPGQIHVFALGNALARWLRTCGGNYPERQYGRPAERRDIPDSSAVDLWVAQRQPPGRAGEGVAAIPGIRRREPTDRLEKAAGQKETRARQTPP